LNNKVVELGSSMTWTGQLPGARSPRFRIHVEIKPEMRNTFILEMKIKPKASRAITALDIESFELGEGCIDKVSIHSGRTDAEM
jgi:hypothetical protein